MNAVEASIVQECEDDYVGLWEIVKIIRANGSGCEDVMLQTLSVIENIMSTGKVVAGNFEKCEFIQCNVSLKRLLDDIAFQWTVLDRDPNIGEIVWFTTK